MKKKSIKIEVLNVVEHTVGKSDNYRQAIWADLSYNTGDPSADKNPLKAENLKITAKPRLGLIKSFIRYNENCIYLTPPSVLQCNSTLQNSNRIQGFQRTQ